MAKARDPRDIVTPDAFSVAPELLGKPLASPPRRLAAMLTDLVAVGVLSGLPGLVFGLVAAFVLFRAAVRPAAGTAAFVALRRRVLLALAAGVLAVVAAVTWLQHAKGEGKGVNVTFGSEKVAVRPADALGLVAEVIALQTADTDDERTAAAAALLDHIRAVEPDDDRVREIVAEVSGEIEDPLTRAAIDEALSKMPRKRLPAKPSPERLRQYADVLAADPSAAEPLRAELAPGIAAPEIAAAHRRATAAEAEVRELRDEVAGMRRPSGVRGMLQGLADDLGLGIGWTALYFTAFTVWWRGRTPGKRLFGCRVVRLDGKPLTAWQAFNRAGGYAASLATGLLGFAEILWDPNRQALHDRIAGTVVLRDRHEA